MKLWGLPTRLEWALAPDRVANVPKLGSRPDAWPSDVCVGLGAGTGEFLFRQVGNIPGRVLGVTPQGLLGLFSVQGTSWVSVVWRGTP